MICIVFLMFILIKNIEKPKLPKLVWALRKQSQLETLIVIFTAYKFWLVKVNQRSINHFYWFMLFLPISCQVIALSLAWKIWVISNILKYHCSHSFPFDVHLTRHNIRQAHKAICILEGLVSGRLLGLEHRQAHRVNYALTLVLWLGS